MTTEEKAKAYDEALNKCKEVFDFNNLSYTHCEIEEKLQQIFPELKESEDERIRENILTKMRACQKQSNFFSNDEIAYLERQKEVDYLGVKIPFPVAYSAVSDAGYVIIPKKEYEEYLEEIRTFAYNGGIVDTEKKYEKEQKPVDYTEELKKCKENPLYFFDKYVKIKMKPSEWSEEDEEMIARICANLEYIVKEAGSDSKYKEKLEERIKWMKRLKSLCPRPKAEWSEEDKKILESIIARYEFNVKSDFAAFITKDALEDFKKELEWLKNLRPQPHWKPSEEQMEALNDAVGDYNAEETASCEKTADILTSLYNDLQKLL